MNLYTSCFSHCLNKQLRGKRFAMVHSSEGGKGRAAGVAWPYNSGNLQHDLSTSCRIRKQKAPARTKGKYDFQSPATWLCQLCP